MGIDGLKMPYKLLMAVTNLTSCYWSLVKCAKYFAPLHPKLTEGHKALGMALNAGRNGLQPRRDAQWTGKVSNCKNFRRWCGCNSRDCIIVELRAERYSSD
jgi:hypothetical protein